MIDKILKKAADYFNEKDYEKIVEKWSKIKNTDNAAIFILELEKRMSTPNWDALKSQGRVALRKIAVATPLNSKAPVLTHKSYCSNCNRDSFITWITYPNERNKKLGCAVCKEKINVHESYKIKG